MPYITREDGEHFVIPSYRDVLSSKSKTQLKKDILLLSKSYGDHITMQKKNAMQYEVAFSTDTGYLLGESVWQHFNKPDDMIYCEAIPGSTEVILVIVKNGSVYLDGSFQADNVSEELVVFLTQEAHFEIVTYGDVPISDSSVEGKFSFDPKSVKSFTVLDKPVFQTLSLLPAYKLQLVDVVLKTQGIGVPPIRSIIIAIVVAGLGWYLWALITTPAEQTVELVQAINPYQSYIDTMHSPLPEDEIASVVNQLKNWLIIPGWVVTDVTYSSLNGKMVAKVVSSGGRVEDLYVWSKKNRYDCVLTKEGYTITSNISATKIDRSQTINKLEEVTAVIIDRIASVYPGHHMTIADMEDKKEFKQSKFTVTFDNFAPLYMNLVGMQFKGLPFVVNEMKGTIKNGKFQGTMTLTALGN